MADQQGHGLQIALVVTIVLLIGTMVLAGILYQNFSKCRSDVETLMAKLQQARQTEQLMTDHIQSLITLVGLPNPEQWVDKVGQPSDEPNEAGNTVWSRANAILLAHQNRFNDQSLNNLFAVAQRLDAELQKFEQNYKALAEKIEPVLQAIRQQLEDEKNALMQETSQKLAQLEEELRNVESQLDQKLDEIEKQSQQYRQRASQAMMEKQQLEKDKAALEQEFRQKVSQLAAQVRQLRRLTESKAYLAKPDGDVLSSHVADGYVIVSVGYADNLKPMTRFSVWGANQVVTPYWRTLNEEAEQDALETLGEQNKTNIEVKPLQGPKAAVEVIEILGDHEAMARIVWHDKARPLAVGDKIFNPVWSPGRKHRVALVGLFDLDGDKQDDRALLKHMLAQHGCVVDLEVLPDGTTEGELSALTDWVVLGHVPGITDVDEGIEENEEQGGFQLHRVTQAAQGVVRDAANLGVPTIAADEFYEFLGYQPHSRIYDPASYQAGTEAAARERAQAGQPQSGSARGNVPAPGFLRYIRY